MLVLLNPLYLKQWRKTIASAKPPRLILLFAIFWAQPFCLQYFAGNYHSQLNETKEFTRRQWGDHPASSGDYSFPEPFLGRRFACKTRLRRRSDFGVTSTSSSS